MPTSANSYTYARSWDPVKREAVGLGPADEVRRAAQEADTTFVVVAHDEAQRRWAYMVVDERELRYEVSYTFEEPIFPAEFAGAVQARATFIGSGDGRLFESSFSVSAREPSDPEAEAHLFRETYEHYPDGTMVHVEEYEPGVVSRTEFRGLDETGWYLSIPKPGDWDPLFMKNAGG